MTNGISNTNSSTSNSKPKQMPPSPVAADSRVVNGQPEKRQSRNTRHTLNPPLAPPPPPPPSAKHKLSSKSAVATIPDTIAPTEPTLTESTNIEKNNMETKKLLTANKKRKQAQKRKSDLVNIAEKNENLLGDADEQEPDDDVDEQAVKSVGSSNTNESSSSASLTQLPVINMTPVNLDDNTLDGFSEASRSKIVKETEDTDVDVEKLTADENTTTQMDADDKLG